jgi:hypothetical protein
MISLALQKSDLSPTNDGELDTNGDLLSLILVVRKIAQISTAGHRNIYPNEVFFGFLISIRWANCLVVGSGGRPHQCACDVGSRLVAVW